MEESGKMQDELMSILLELRKEGVFFTECDCCNNLKYAITGGRKTLTEQENELIKQVHALTNKYL